MRNHPSIQSLHNLLRELGSISWTDLKTVAMPNIYKYPNELVRTLQKMEEEGIVTIERESLGVKRDRFFMIHYTERVLPRFEKIKEPKPVTVIQKVKREVNLDEVMPCKARLVKCFHVGCYLADICSIRPEYINKRLQQFERVIV